MSFRSFGRGEQLGRDGSLGVYGGKAPHVQKAKLWTAGTGAKGGATGSQYELVYSRDRVVLNKDGKVGPWLALGSWPDFYLLHIFSRLGLVLSRLVLYCLVLSLSVKSVLVLVLVLSYVLFLRLVLYFASLSSLCLLWSFVKRSLVLSCLLGFFVCRSVCLSVCLSFACWLTAWSCGRSCFRTTMKTKTNSFKSSSTEGHDPLFQRLARLLS